MAAKFLGNISPSRDTIFMRGFSARQHIDDIREFFQHENARNTVEFFKDDGNNQLFIALRFDTKEIAKDIINRYDNTDILGDRIQMQFYKDLRRLRTNDFQPHMNHRHMYHDDQYDFRRNDRSFDRGDRRDDRGGYSGRRGGGGWQRGGGSGDMKRGGGRHDRGYHMQQSVVASRPRRYTRSSSRSRSPTRSRSSSRSYSRSSSGSATRTKRRRSESEVGHKRKISRRKANKTTSRSSLTPDRKSSRSTEPKNTDKKPSDWTPTSDRNSTTALSGAKDKNMDSSYNQELDTEEPDAPTDQSGLETTVEQTNVPEGVKPPRALQSIITGTTGDKLKSKNVLDDDQQLSEFGSMEIDDLIVQQNSLPPGKSSSKGKKRKNTIRPAVDDEASEEEGSNSVDKLATVLGTGRRPRGSQDESIVSPPRAAQKSQPSTITGKGLLPPCEATSSSMGSFEFYDPSADPRLSRRKKTAPPPLADDEDDMEDTRPSRDTYRESPKASSSSSRKRPPVYSDVLPNGLTPRDLTPERAAKIRAKKMEIEKTELIKSKKAEIEQAYRQDCETFAIVTKLLISKDPGLEERIQHSLRDNLKEIGQRCIQELRDFVEQLKTTDDDQDVE